MIDETESIPPPGRLVDVGGYSLHLFSKGTGTPTIVIESGLAGGSMVWGLVQPEIADIAQVVTYDRAGYGWSDAGPLPRSIDQIVTALHTLLVNAGIAGPYILVGHSFGGLIMRLFASRYPEEVVGLILVDALSEYLFTRSPILYRAWSRQLGRTFRLLWLIARLGLLRVLVWFGQARRLPEVVTRQPKDQQALLLASGFLSGENFATALAELSLFEPGADRVREATLPTDIPLVVLSHGRATMFSSLPSGQARQAEQIWQEFQRELSQLSPQGRLIVATRSGHDIHIDQPEPVIEAIRLIVAQYKEVVLG